MGDVGHTCSISDLMSFTDSIGDSGAVLTLSPQQDVVSLNVIRYDALWFSNRSILLTNIIMMNI